MLRESQNGMELNPQPVNCKSNALPLSHHATRTNQKLLYDFLSVINTNLPAILHCLWDIALEMSQIALIGYPSWV